MHELILKDIETKIYIIRGQKVMLDSDLAELYGVETRIINRNVKRSNMRFPNDFMFQLDAREYESLKSQIGISKEGKGGRRNNPFVFTENGIAMLSSVLNSERAILINISIIRIFTKPRSFFALETNMNYRMDTLEKDTTNMFKIVFEKFDGLENRVNKLDQDLPAYPMKRKKIGITPKKDKKSPDTNT